MLSFPTGIKDINLLILEKLEDKDLANVARVNKQCYELCNNETLWYKKCEKRFGMAVNIKKYPPYKKLYIELNDYMEHVYEDRILENKSSYTLKSLLGVYIKSPVIKELSEYHEEMCIKAFDIFQNERTKQPLEKCLNKFLNIPLIDANLLLYNLGYTNEFLNFLLEYEGNNFRLTHYFLYRLSSDNDLYFSKFLKSKKYNNRIGERFILQFFVKNYVDEEAARAIHEILSLMNREEFRRFMDKIYDSNIINQNYQLKLVFNSYYSKCKSKSKKEAMNIFFKWSD